MSYFDGGMFGVGYFNPGYFGQLTPITPLLPAVPNERRRVVVMDDISGYCVENYTLNELDVITFDFSHRLSRATLTDAEEVIANILTFSLESVDGVDKLVSARSRGIAAFENSLVSQKFGNWRYTSNYKATCSIYTTRNNIVTATATFSILPAP